MKDFKKFREQLNEYGLTPAMLKKSNPLRGKGYPHNESQRFGGKTNIPASPETKKYIESGKGIILDVPSSLHPTSRFAIYKNPAKGSRQDKVLMATISNPKRGRVKMFSFHGSHVSHQKAMDFAKKHKLVAMKDKDGNPLYAKESVELDEAHLKKGDKVKWKGKVGTVVRYDKGGPQSPFYVVSFKGQYKSENIPAHKLKESVELDEDNTAAVAKQVKQAVKKYTKGKLVVRSKGGKTRFIMVMSDNIDNKLRKMMADVMYPKANITDKSNISYGNISDRIISASAEHWAKALGLKEIYTRPSYGKPEEGSTRGVYSSKTFSKMKEQIANVAGSGAVAGLGDEPPVSKAAQKKKQMGATGDIARRKSIPAPKKGDLIPPALGESVETFAGCRVFEVEDEEYGKALYGRKKWERWSKKLDMNKETNQVIRTYASRNPGKPVVLKNKKTGDMSYLINKNY